MRGRFSFIPLSPPTCPLVAADPLTASRDFRTIFVGKERTGEDGSLDRILRGLKLHAQGRQFGDQNS